MVPASLRKSPGLSKGDKVSIEANGDDIISATARFRRKRAQALARRSARPDISLVAEFLSEKRVKAEREIDQIEPAAGSGKTDDGS